MNPAVTPVDATIQVVKINAHNFFITVVCGKSKKLYYSDNAAGMGGSQVFLDKGCEYTVDNLIRP